MLPAVFCFTIFLNRPNIALRKKLRLSGSKEQTNTFAFATKWMQDWQRYPIRTFYNYLSVNLIEISR